MTLIYFFLTLTAIMIISNSLFYRIGALNSRRKIQSFGYGPEEFVPSVLGIGQTFQQHRFNITVPSESLIKSINEASSESSRETNSSKSTSYGYKPVTGRMTIVYTINN
jgi:hypothetical protein